MNEKQKSQEVTDGGHNLRHILAQLDAISATVENTRAAVLSGVAGNDEDRGDIALLARAEAESAGHDLIPAEVANRIFAGENPVRVFREWRGLQQKDLAKLAGLSQGFLSEIEGGKTAGAHVYKRIADILRVDMAMLLQEDERPESAAPLRLYRLTPRLLDNPAWEGSTWKAPVVIRAPSESAARWAASFAFRVATRAVVGRKATFDPWRMVDMTECAEINEPKYSTSGEVAVLDPAEYSGEIPSGIDWANL